MSQSNQRKQLDDEEQLTMIQLKVHSLHIIVLSTTILIISNKMQIAGVVECKKGNKHSNMPIQMICLNTQCEMRRLCCLTCIDELHRKHELISLNKFYSMLEVLTEKREPEMQRNICKVVQNYQTELMKILQTVIVKFTKEVKSCQEKIKEALALVYSTIDVQNQNAMAIKHLQEDFTNERVCKYLHLIAEMQGLGFTSIDNAKTMVQAARKLFQKSVEECQKHYLKGVEELTKGIDRVKTSLSKYRTNKSNKFSLVHKASCLTINEHQDVAKRGEGSGGYPIVLIEERISEFNDNVSVKIVEQPGNKGIWIGVCVLDIVKTFNYQSCYGIGKGTWAIDQVGQTHVSAYTWSHHDSAYNSQPKVVLQRLLQGFQFAVGDTINIRVDFQKKVVIFTKGDAVYEQPIKTDIGDIYAFVGPTHINDSISLVS